jgi:type IV pilus assembly protein PilV
MRVPVKNSKVTGFTLIEVMVAMLIMSVGIMALMQTLVYAITFSHSNKLRNEAILIAGSAMEARRIRPFSNITTPRVPFALGYVNYSVVSTVTKFASYTTSANIQVTVSWRDKAVRKSHSLSTVVSY